MRFISNSIAARVPIIQQDTRHSRRLLSRYGIKAEMVSFHEHNEQQREASVLDRLRGGQSAGETVRGTNPALPRALPECTQCRVYSSWVLPVTLSWAVHQQS